VTMLFDPGIFTVLGINGAALVGAKLYWYATGTTTPVVTYSDQATTVANQNPVPADGYGRFPQIWLPAASYKFVLTDASNNVIRTQDPWVSEPSAPTIAAALNSFLAGSSALPIANGGTASTTAVNALAALGGLPLTGGALTGNVTRATKGGLAYFNTAAMTDFQVFLTPMASADPRTPTSGQVWARY
jgi:hypothetical protein